PCKFRVGCRSLTVERFAAGRRGRRRDPSHALSERGRRPGVLLKSRYLRRISMLIGRKLALTLAFTVLVAVAFGVSCRGFFVKPTLASITIQPATPSVELGQTATLQAYGLD